MLTLEVGGKKPDEVTDAVAEYLLKKDESRDHWRGSSNRPPSEASEFTSTYLALRALAAYGKEGQKDRIAARVAKARRWLEATRPKDTEDRVFRLLALKAASAPGESIRKASDDLLRTRRDDGGWSQLDGGKSDAYATGSALFALHTAGRVATDSPEYRGGLKFLIADQREDGSWFVASRSKPFQPYFESGFPYGKDQFISMAATSWAVTALSLAMPEITTGPKTEPSSRRISSERPVARVVSRPAPCRRIRTGSRPGASPDSGSGAARSGGTGCSHSAS